MSALLEANALPARKGLAFMDGFKNGMAGSETCLGCGDMWTDGEMHDRPFARGWRQENIKDAKESIKKMREQTKERG